VPVYLAARSAGTLRVACEVADGAILGSLFVLERFDDAVRQIDSSARRGTSARRCRVGPMGQRLFTDLEASDLAAFKIEIGRVLGRAGDVTLRTCGMTDARIVELRAAHERGGAASRASSPITRCGARVFGDPAACRRTLSELEARGADRYVLLLREATSDRHIEILTHFARHVIS
jgi:alkanesulfonate monooxygenase SsuD/methylene tetrahydromethanopterin reductase-like flavin-dependent oxidoreductase (luciferase family)